METIELYHPEDLFALSGKHRVRRVILLVFAALSLGVCLFLCSRVTPSDARMLERTVNVSFHSEVMHFFDSETTENLLS
ncbi:MAG: hypothetical protein J5379_07870 [Clostridiales bacterium]|nr:hypothetical protein [Clostridiales bacterium]